MQVGDLTEEHYKKLNGLKLKPEEQAKLARRLRGAYTRDPRARWQLDVFDPTSEHNKKIGLALKAIQNRDYELAKQILSSMPPEPPSSS